MKHIINYILALTMLVAVVESSTAQSTLSQGERTAIAATLQKITLKEVAGSYVKVKDVRIRKRNIEVRTSEELSYYPMRPESLEAIYDSVRSALPEKYRNYSLAIYSNDRLIDDLIPQYYDPNHKSKHFTYREGVPLIRRTSELSQPTNGLQSRHIAMWQSHGRYFKNSIGAWSWQRSCLWETVEDLYTQSYVVPYLVPMLERAGATVLLPRERSMRIEEVILDNDQGITPSKYCEYNNGAKWAEAGVGFAHVQENYLSGHNPFMDGTARMASTTKSVDKLSVATWGGSIPTSGMYSLYVAYRTLPNSVTDAHYTVHASGADHTFLVNQKMGSAMWVCLGEFFFEEGEYDELVTLSNLSEEDGVVVADAIKIGGGMGNIRRGVATKDGVITDTISGYPRFTEGARYWLQWSGFEPDVYAPKGGTDDYKEDYMSRPHWVNALMGGSERLPDSVGKNIPVDLALAMHSDAGVRDNDDVVGTLGIYCTRDNKGEFTANISRDRSRDLTDQVMTQIVADIRALYEPEWKRRGMWDRAYYEARIPNCPTMLLELLSHQNYGDMSYGLDPQFRFDVSRAIYKGVLRYLSVQYDFECVVQPLPVHNFAVVLDGNSANISWQPTVDPMEPTAMPDYYILYTRVDDGGFDTGRRVDGTSVVASQETDRIYSYRVTAVNRGGESFDSETLSACRCSMSTDNVLVVNGFTRVSAPQRISTDSTAGFLHTYDGGVPYISDISFIGEQTIFDRSLARATDDRNALGTSQRNYETMVIAGNSFDYPALHGRSIVAAGYSFSSASRGAVEDGAVDLSEFRMVDLILGKQRAVTIGRSATSRHEVLSKTMQQQLRNYTATGGALLITGAYTLDDLLNVGDASANGQAFAEEVLHVSLAGVDSITRRVITPITLGSKRSRETCKIGEVELSRDYSSAMYRLESAEEIVPIDGDAHTILQYQDGGSAAVAYVGDYRAIVVGFPFESIAEADARDRFMDRSINFLTTKSSKREATLKRKSRRRNK